MISAIRQTTSRRSLRGVANGIERQIFAAKAGSNNASRASLVQWSARFHARAADQLSVHSESSYSKYQHTRLRYFSTNPDDRKAAASDAKVDSAEGKPKENDATEDDAVSSSTASAWDQIRSPPNIITLSRMASTPLLATCILTEHHTLALAGCFIAGVSDYMDGYLAKNYNMSTVLGTYLDPLADKLVINVLALSLWQVGTLPAPLVAFWVIKDIGLVGMTGVYLRQNTGSFSFMKNAALSKPLKVEPTTMAKINTALQFATLGLAIVEPTLASGAWMVHLGPEMEYSVLTSLCWITGGTSLASLFSYMGFSALKVKSK